MPHTVITSCCSSYVKHCVINVNNLFPFLTFLSLIFYKRNIWQGLHPKRSLRTLHRRLQRFIRTSCALRIYCLLVLFAGNLFILWQGPTTVGMFCYFRSHYKTQTSPLSNILWNSDVLNAVLATDVKGQLDRTKNKSWSVLTDKR